MLSPIPSNSIIFLVHFAPAKISTHDHFQSIQGSFDLRPIMLDASNFKDNMQYSFRYILWFVANLTQMIKLLKVQPDSKLVWVIDRDFCQATKSRTKTLFFGSDNSFAGNISMPTQKWIRRSSQSIQKRLLDYSIFIPSKLGLPLLYQSDY